MIDYKFGQIVLVDFPYSETRQIKRRPALVVLDVGDNDVVLAPITTTERRGGGDYKIKGWSVSGLLKVSWVRLAKVTCLWKGSVARQLGSMTDHDRKKILALWRRMYLKE